VRVCAPDGAARELDMGGVRYRSSDGVYDLPESHARALVRNGGGFFPSLAAPRGRVGYPCRSCGFASLFRACSRCGTENDHG
jgi:hypothetical protein